MYTLCSVLAGPAIARRLAQGVILATLHACTICGKPSSQARCPAHRRDPKASWSPNRDRGKQRRFRAAVLERDGHRCTFRNEYGERCPVRVGLRAAHIKPLREFALGDPEMYSPANGRCLCKFHDRLTDPHAR